MAAAVLVGVVYGTLVGVGMAVGATAMAFFEFSDRKET
jgi:hypothetical protein